MGAVSIGTDAEEFWQRAGGWLEREPVLHSVLLTTVDRARRGSASEGVFAIVSSADGEGVAGVAVWTPPFRAYVSAAPVGAERLALALLDQYPDIDGVTGVAEQAAAYARVWAAHTGGTVGVAMDQRLFELDTVVPPRPSPGAARLAGPADRELLVEWTVAFEVESNAAPGASVAERVVDLLIAEQRAWLWDDDGPACFVGVSRTVAGVARVAPVYTPPDRRRRGYASALVAAVSQTVLDAGAHRSALFTDLANPTSNKVYTALGYRPVADVTAYVFTR